MDSVVADSVVLLSGGLDSTVVLAYAIEEGRHPLAVSFRYGQKHSRELRSAKAVADHYGVSHQIIDLDLSFLRSSLICNDQEIPSRRHEDEMSEIIPNTYVPARNIILLSVAAGICESVNAHSIYIGANSVDYSGYPDCRAEFFQAYEDMLAVGTKAGVEGKPISVETPILFLSKGEIVSLGKELGAPLGLTWSCYRGGEKACGTCDSCRLRLRGFAEAGYEDEIEYEVIE
ncbi:MAG TPA: 7-cyano-7-deazaguanine synthase QueC [Candidatus Methanomethylophilaceae archaeon]|nr:7-cyano-7-deazaguanine synthase QueC [Candidatus Methanomethylophilaceae archaeon]